MVQEARTPIKYQIQLHHLAVNYVISLILSKDKINEENTIIIANEFYERRSEDELILFSHVEPIEAAFNFANISCDGRQVIWNRIQDDYRRIMDGLDEIADEYHEELDFYLLMEKIKNKHSEQK